MRQPSLAFAKAQYTPARRLLSTAARTRKCRKGRVDVIPPAGPSQRFSTLTGFIPQPKGDR